MTLVLEKTKGFESADEEVRKGLETLFGRRFVNLVEIKEAMYRKVGLGKPLLPKNVYISTGENVRADNLPFMITEWPIYCFEGYGVGGLSEVAKIRVLPL